VVSEKKGKIPKVERKLAEMLGTLYWTSVLQLANIIVSEVSDFYFYSDFLL